MHNRFPGFRVAILSMYFNTNTQSKVVKYPSLYINYLCQRPEIDAIVLTAGKIGEKIPLLPLGWKNYPLFRGNMI